MKYCLRTGSKENTHFQERLNLLFTDSQEGDTKKNPIFCKKTKFLSLKTGSAL